MKNLLQIIILTIITSFIFASCSNKVSLTKRKYNKGYYVSHSHKKADVKAQTAVAAVKNVPVEKSEPIILKTEPTQLPTTNQKDLNLTAAVAQPVENNSPILNKTEKSNGNAFAKKFYKIKPLEKILPSQLYTKEVKEKLSRDGDDALSLFWIIILVILILYLVGLAADDFGIGSAIHVLALVALILLILWLLRIV